MPAAASSARRALSLSNPALLSFANSFEATAATACFCWSIVSAETILADVPMHVIRDWHLDLMRRMGMATSAAAMSPRGQDLPRPCC